MPHLDFAPGLPGIRGPMAFRPETAKPLNELVDILLRGAHTLSPGERELIATYVSAQNDCRYCQTIHGAIAAHHLSGDEALVLAREDATRSRPPISDKLKALLVIAGKTARGGKHVTAGDIARARASTAPPTSRSTMPSSSRRSSVCAIATSMVSRRGRPTILCSTASARRSSPSSGTSAPRPLAPQVVQQMTLR